MVATSTTLSPNATDANVTTAEPLVFDDDIRKSTKALGFEAYMLSKDTLRACNKINYVTMEIEEESADGSDEVGSDSEAAKKDSMFSYGFIAIQVSDLYDVIKECNETLSDGENDTDSIWDLTDQIVDIMESGSANITDILSLFEMVKNDTALYDSAISEWSKKLTKLAMNVITAARDAYKMVRDDSESGAEAVDDAKDAMTEIKYMAGKIKQLAKEMVDHKDEIYEDIMAYQETVEKELETY